MRPSTPPTHATTVSIDKAAPPEPPAFSKRARQEEELTPPRAGTLARRSPSAIGSEQEPPALSSESGAPSQSQSTSSSNYTSHNSQSQHDSLVGIHDGSWGIDTVVVAVPVNYDDCYVDARKSRSYSSQRRSVEATIHTTNFDVGDANVRVTIDSAWRTAKLEFNAARALAQKPVPWLLPPYALRTIVRYVVEQAGPMLSPVFQSFNADGTFEWEATWPKEVKILRLDVARNFLVAPEEVATVKRELPSLAGRGMGRGRLSLDFSPGGGWTLSRRTKSTGSDIFYDKHAQDPDVPEGTFRFETQMKKSRLKERNLITLAQVNEERLDYALRRAWQARRLGDAFPWPVDRVELFADVDPSKRHLYNSFLGDCADGDLSLYGVREAKRLKAEVRRAGFKPGRSLLSHSPWQARLDLASGKLLRERRSP